MSYTNIFVVAFVDGEEPNGALLDDDNLKNEVYVSKKDCTIYLLVSGMSTLPVTVRFE